MTKRQALGEGQTIDEAIANALQELQVERDQVVVEILQEPSKRLFGRRSKPARVRLSVKDSPAKGPKNGLIGITNGRLSFTPPEPGGEAPVIRFSTDIQVVYQDQPVEGQVVLTEGVEPLRIVLPPDQEPELHYKVIVNPAKTKAELYWKRTPGVHWKLAEEPPAPNLRLRLQQISVEAPRLTLGEVRQIAQVEGLSYGLRLDTITEAELSRAEGRVVLAVGEEPRQPRHASIKYIFQEEAVDLDAIRIDHYEVHGIAGVQQGDLLAVKDPGEPGLPGRDVYGNVIPPEPLRDVTLQVGEGAELSSNGLKATATISGLPSLQGGVLRVNKVFELAGDADIATGNIRIDGDIIIRGNVLENVKVESSTGRIVVNGLVSGATLRSGGTITVLRNVVRSQLYAGGASVTQIQLLDLLKRIVDQLEGLLVAYQSILTQTDKIPFESLIKHLIELKFYNLPKYLQQLGESVEQIPEHSSEGLHSLSSIAERSIFDGSSLVITDLDELLQFRSAILGKINELESEQTVEADVKVAYLQNTRVEASGQVEVTGQGSFYSTVLAGTGFSVPNGLFRGGEVTVNIGKVSAKEFGGPTGIATKVQILKQGTITANLVHPNVVFAIGAQHYKFDDSASQVKAFLQEGTLTIYSGSRKIHG